MDDEIVSRQIVTYSEAKKCGLVRYFTGKPCRKGHVAERYTANGRCAACLSELQIAKRSSGPKRQKYVSGRPCKFGHTSERTPSGFCIECRRAWDREWAASNPEKVHAKAQHRWRVHKAKNVAYAKEWYRLNPNANREYVARRRALSLSADGKYTQEDVVEIAEQQGWLCFYCFEPLLPGYQVDHFEPLSRGGSNWPENLRIACPGCNARKGDKDPLAFMKNDAVCQNASAFPRLQLRFP